MKKIILLGVCDKKIFLPFLSAVFLILSGYIGGFVPTFNYSFYIGEFGTSFGFMLAIFLNPIFKLDNEYSICEMFTKNSVKDSSLFLLSYAIFRSTAFIVHFSIYSTERVGPLCSNQGLEIILLLLMTKLILKYKYYIHNIISLLLFCLFSAIIDLISGNFSKLKSIDSVYCFAILFEVIFYCHMKYMIDKKYHKYWEIIFFQGFSNFIFDIISVIIRILIDKDSNFIVDYFSEEEIRKVTANFFFSMISGFIQQVLNVLIIYLFTPNHMLIPYVINKIKRILFDSNKADYYHLFCIIPAIFEILSLLFFLEIFEFNFCGLNKNTRKNIQLREKEDMQKKEFRENYTELDHCLLGKNGTYKRDSTSSLNSDMGEDKKN
jgi:hypothetical protein